MNDTKDPARSVAQTAAFHLKVPKYWNWLLYILFQGYQGHFNVHLESVKQ